VPGGYTTVTGVQIGDVRFDKMTAGAPLPNVLSRRNFNFLTLDVLANAPNSEVDPGCDAAGAAS
jgi:hypothetical protein